LRIVSRRAIREFCADHAEAAKPLDSWYRIARQAEWRSIADVRATYPHADAVGRCTVFNIHGNPFRLISAIH
jgi:mRNA interferase HigB